MTIPRVDFAIFGATPLAMMLAGLLASVHGRKVCLVGDAPSAFRLGRGFDFSIPIATRPELWAMLRATTPEATKLLSRAGAQSAMKRIDPVFVAQTADGIAALSHIRHVALGFGFEVSRIADDAVLAPSVSVRWRDAVVLVRPQAERQLEIWLGRLGVLRMPGKQASLTGLGGGGFSIGGMSGPTEAEHVVLADDPSIAGHLDPGARDALFSSIVATSLLTEPAAPLLSPLIVVIDRDLIYWQGATRAVAAMALGRTDHALVRIGGDLGGNGALRRAGQSVFRVLVSRDGAPVFGGPLAQGPTVVGALGPSGVFLAPAIARRLAGKSTVDEDRFFSRYSADPEARRVIGDLMPAASRSVA